MPVTSKLSRVTMRPGRGAIEFRHRPHTLHGLDAAIVNRVGHGLPTRLV
jgi:hypothetical protein